MDPRKFSFLKAVLGEDGAAALKKAADRLNELETAIVPRAIMAWLGVVARGDYEGEIPGVENSYIDFSKNEDGLYDGTVAIDDETFPFQNASVFHLAASVALVLGSATEIDSRLKDRDLVNLGKSIDLLAKGQYLVTMDKLEKGVPGPAHAPRLEGIPTPPTPGSKQVDKGPKLPGKGLPKPPSEAPKPKRVIPKAKVVPPKPVIPGRKPAAKSFSMSERQSLSECPDCGLPLIKNARFTGCVCFKELARYVTLSKNEGGLTISFGPEVDADAMSVILDTLGVSDGRR